MKRLIVITGPTACGKTSISVELAKLLNTEIISCDSRQFYFELCIGTARPSADEMQNVKHHFVGSHSITEEINAGYFERLVIPLLETLFKKYDDVILTGGSGLFIDAVVNGFDEMPAINAGVRENLNDILKTKGIAPLLEMLQQKDPEYSKTVDKHNPKRIIRALEICISTEKKYSELRIGRKAKRFFKTIKIVLDRPREELYHRINTRVDHMIDQGLIEEVRSLQMHKNLNALQTVGYREIFSYLDQKITRQEAIDLMKRNSRRYAKRQLTWFRRDPEYHWVSAPHLEKISKIIQKLG